MRKRGASVVKQIKDRLLTKAEVRRYALPLHTALVVLPIGGFTREHANKLAGICNIVLVDAQEGPARDAAQKVGDTLVAMFSRVKQGKAWNVTAAERDGLMSSIVEMDHHLQRMTWNRLRIAVATSNIMNQRAKAEGWTFLDQVSVNQEQSL